MVCLLSLMGSSTDQGGSSDDRNGADAGRLHVPSDLFSQFPESQLPQRRPRPSVAELCPDLAQAQDALVVRDAFPQPRFVKAGVAFQNDIHRLDVPGSQPSKVHFRSQLTGQAHVAALEILNANQDDLPRELIPP